MNNNEILENIKALMLSNNIQTSDYCIAGSFAGYYNGFLKNPAKVAFDIDIYVRKSVLKDKKPITCVKIGEHHVDVIKNVIDESFFDDKDNMLLKDGLYWISPKILLIHQSAAYVCKKEGSKTEYIRLLLDSLGISVDELTSLMVEHITNGTLHYHDKLKQKFHDNLHLFEELFL